MWGLGDGSACRVVEALQDPAEVGGDGQAAAAIRGEGDGLTVTGAGEGIVPGALEAVDWADVSASCELRWLARAVILRPACASVAAAVAASLLVEVFVACHERLSRGKVGQMVALQVRDWATSRSVDVCLTVIVRASDEASARAVAQAQGALGSVGLEALAPGFWRTPPGRLGVVRAALARARLRVTSRRPGCARDPIGWAVKRSRRLRPEAMPPGAKKDLMPPPNRQCGREASHVGARAVDRQLD